MEKDIIIVGSGGAGASAALSAYEAGVSDILILEKAPFSGGASGTSGGNFSASASKLDLQGKHGISDSRELHFKDTMEAGEHMGNPELVKILCDQAPGTIDWLVDMGFRFQENLLHLGGHSVPRSYNFLGGGAGMMKTARELLNKKGIPILLKHRVVDMARKKQGEGRVTGVRVVVEGEEKIFKARKGVVLATGGFAANLRMRRNHNPILDEALGNTSTEYVTGDGIIMGKSIMADTVGMDFIQVIPRTSPDGRLDNAAVETFWKIGQGAINVNLRGKRFVNSMAKRAVESKQILKQERPVCVIYDEKIRSLPGILKEAQYKQLIKKGRIITGDSLKTLAGKTGISYPALEETIREFNGFVDRGEDPEFGRKDLPSKIERPPFYAVPSWSAVHYTMGGLLINGMTQVVDIWGDVIPGLYAAGEIAGGLHGASRLAANSIAEIWVFGRIAGLNVASEKPYQGDV